MSSIKLVCFDLDGTLIKENSWYLLNTALGVTPEEDADLFSRYKNGTLTYDAWIAELVALYIQHGKASRKYISEVFSHIAARPEFSDVIQKLQSAGCIVAIISGSFDEAVRHVAQTLGVEHAHGCASLVFGEDDMLQNVVTKGDEAGAKLHLLSTMAESLSIPLSACACIGDGGNHVEMFRATGRGITFRGSPIEGNAWRVIDSITEVPDIIASV